MSQSAMEVTSYQEDTEMTGEETEEGQEKEKEKEKETEVEGKGKGLEKGKGKEVDMDVDEVADSLAPYVVATFGSSPPP
jgi:hypothetical protein